MSENLKDEDVYYIFFNPVDPINIHNFNISKKIMSATFERIVYEQSEELLNKYCNGTLRYTHFDYCESDLFKLSQYGWSVTKDFFKEYNGEYVRRQKYANTKPSRFSCLFAFKDMESVQQAIKLFNWNKDELKKFKLIPCQLNRITKVNMSIVSVLNGLYNDPFNCSIKEGIWEAYWQGLEKIPYNFVDKYNLPLDLVNKINESPTVWEYLIEGALILVEE